MCCNTLFEWCTHSTPIVYCIPSVSAGKLALALEGSGWLCIIWSNNQVNCLNAQILSLRLTNKYNVMGPKWLVPSALCTPKGVYNALGALIWLPSNDKITLVIHFTAGAHCYVFFLFPLVTWPLYYYYSFMTHPFLMHGLLDSSLSHTQINCSLVTHFPSHAQTTCTNTFSNTPFYKYWISSCILPSLVLLNLMSSKPTSWTTLNNP